MVLLQGTGFPPELWPPMAQEPARFYRVIVPSYYDHREVKFSNEVTRIIINFFREVQFDGCSDEGIVAGHI
jgi:hypothetical protein